MSPLPSPRTIVHTLILTNGALAAWLGVLVPERWPVALIGGLLLPVCALTLRLATRNGSCSPGSRRETQEHLAMGAFMISAALGIALTNAGGMIEGEVGPRFMGAMLGMLVVFFGNRLPKQGGGHACTAHRPEARQRLHRRVGYTMVVCGLAMSGAWVVLPVAVAKVSFLSIGVAMLVLVVALCQQARVGGAGRSEA